MSFIKTVFFGHRKLTFLHSFLKTICFDSGFSERSLHNTSGCAPSMPASPVLTKAGVTWLSLQWSKPSGGSHQMKNFLHFRDGGRNFSKYMYFK